MKKAKKPKVVMKLDSKLLKPSKEELSRIKDFYLWEKQSNLSSFRVD